MSENVAFFKKARERIKYDEFKFDGVKLKVWFYKNMGIHGEYAVEVITLDSDPYWLENNNSWETTGGAYHAILKHLEEIL